MTTKIGAQTISTVKQLRDAIANLPDDSSIFIALSKTDMANLHKMDDMAWLSIIVYDDMLDNDGSLLNVDTANPVL